MFNLASHTNIKIRSRIMNDHLNQLSSAQISQN